MSASEPKLDRLPVAILGLATTAVLIMTAVLGKHGTENHLPLDALSSPTQVDGNIAWLAYEFGRGRERRICQVLPPNLTEASPRFPARRL